MKPPRGIVQPALQALVVSTALGLQGGVWLVEQTRDQVRTGWLWWRFHRG